MYLRKSTTATVVIGPLMNDSDGRTPINSAAFDASPGVIKMIKGTGGAIASRTYPGTATTSVGSGMYLVTIDAADLNTAGEFRLFVTGDPSNPTASGRRFLMKTFYVLEQQVYDSLIDGVANPADITAVQNTFIGRLNQLWWRFFKRTKLSYGASPFLLQTFANDGTSAATTQTTNDNGSIQSITEAQ